MKPDPSPLTVTVPIRGRLVTAQVWLAAVGRVPLILLDTDRDDNDPMDRWITGRLYDESTLLSVAHAYQQATGNPLERPPLERFLAEDQAGKKDAPST